jgi:apolipoprotein N-acyltransferase
VERTARQFFRAMIEPRDVRQAVATRTREGAPAWVPPLLAATSGALASVPFLVASAGPFLLVALVPLLIALWSRGSPTHATVRAGLLGCLTGAVGLAIAFSWLLPTVARFQRLSTLEALPFLALFVAYHALQFAVFGGGVARLMSRPTDDASRLTVPFCLSVASWWTILEWIFPKIIPWSFGDAFAGSPWLRQAADLGGVRLLGFLIVLANALLAVALCLLYERSRAPLSSLAALVAVLSLWIGYGVTKMQGSEGSGGQQIRVAIVQGGVESGRDDLESANEEAWAIYARLTTRLPSETDLIVWPETVLRVYLRHDEGYRRRISELVEHTGTSVLLGSLDLRAPTAVSTRAVAGELNSAYLLGSTFARGEPAMQVYHKLALLPFGEYVPGTSWLPLLRRWRTTGEFVPGKPPESIQPATLRLQIARGLGERHDPRAPATPVSFAPSICYEVMWPGWHNEAVRHGARFLVNITDDGWFGHTAAPYQHLNAAVLRAVETRRWLVRASNSGISALIDPTGTIAAALPYEEAGTLAGRVLPSEALTPYARFGDWIVLCSALVLAIPVALQMRRSRR